MLSTIGKKCLEMFHPLCACCWLGGALTLFTPPYFPESWLGSTGINRDIQWKDVGIVIIPGAVGCLLTGFLYSWTTEWGFFKHRWLMVKWTLALFSITFGTLVLGPMEKAILSLSYMLGLGATIEAEYWALENLKVVFGTLQITLLIFLIIISVFKPWQKK